MIDSTISTPPKSNGSWAGAYLGLEAIPAHRTGPLHGRTTSAVFGFNQVDLDEMAQRTLALVARLA